MAETPLPYSEKVMDHFRNPRNVGVMENPSGVGKVGNPVCVFPDTLIHKNSGIIGIKDLKIGESVLSGDGYYHQISKVFERDYSGWLYHIRVHNLGEFAVTPEHHIFAQQTSSFDHKFRASKKLVPDWYCAEELKKGDLILYPVCKESKNIKSIDFNVEIPKWDFKSKSLPEQILVNGEFLRLAGYFLAEGSTRTEKCKGTLQFTFGYTEREYAEEVTRAIKNIFGVDCAIPVIKNNSLTVTCYSARLARFFKETFGSFAENKKIPHWMMLLPPEKQTYLISGFWRGDGYVNNWTAKFVTISQELAYQTKILLLRQGIIFSFLKNPAKGIHKKSYSIYIKNEEALKKIASIVGKEIVRPPKKKNPKKSWFADGYYQTPISKIEKTWYEGKVYNLEVPEIHSYLSEAACLHNCGDVMELFIKVENDIITDAKFRTFGCGAAISTSSMVTGLVKGKTLEEALKISNKAVAEALGGLPPIKMHCSVLAEEALKAAIDDYRKKQQIAK